MHIQLIPEKGNFFNSRVQILVVCFLILSLSIFLYLQNNLIVISHIEYASDKLPPAFDECKILQISDLHNKQFGKNQARLIKKISSIAPDIIVITGDLVDSRHTEISKAMGLINRIAGLAPVYYTPGNHEARNNIYEKIEPLLIASGTHVLFNRYENFERANQRIGICGLADPNFLFSQNYEQQLHENLNELAAESKAQFNILLAHDPALHKIYDRPEFALVLSGHAHGGQFRIPFRRGLYAPGQGLFPKYTSGLHQLTHTSMVISRGLGNSAFPLRLFNLPELVVVTLKSS
ncbi:MAG: metallophosphoesterase [Oscillospiraceae bacterium]|nr:metallophosphoesterase [Oscillospiraceae bacterium]